MATYDIDITEEAKIDLAHYSAFERKIILSEIRTQLTQQPDVETKNRKRLRDNPIAAWELRVGRLRVFYEVGSCLTELEDSHETIRMVTIVSVGHKEHNVLWIRGKEVQL